MGSPRYQNFGNRRTQNYSRYEDTREDIQGIVNAIRNGEFSQVRSSLSQQMIRKKISESSARVLDTLKKELREGKFPQWDELGRVRNAALVAAVAVASDLRTTQIRKIIEMAKGLHFQVETSQESEELRERIKAEALHMNVLMAYYAGKNYSILPLQEILEPILMWLAQYPSRENFRKVYAFFEAIVAYHKYFGGKE